MPLALFFSTDFYYERGIKKISVPDTIDPNKGKVIIAKYIIYIPLQYFLLICKKQLEYLN